MFCWIIEVNFGSVLSNKIWSISMVACFWLIIRFIRGLIRCMMGGKYPSNNEKLNMLDCLVCFKFWVK